MSDLMKRKHQLHLIELEETVLLAQVKIISLLFVSDRPNDLKSRKEIIGFAFVSPDPSVICLCQMSRRVF